MNPQLRPAGGQPFGEPHVQPHLPPLFPGAHPDQNPATSKTYNGHDGFSAGAGNAGVFCTLFFLEFLNLSLVVHQHRAFRICVHATQAHNHFFSLWCDYFVQSFVTKTGWAYCCLDQIRQNSNIVLLRALASSGL